MPVSAHQPSALRQRLIADPVLLDGGLATTLELLGHDISGELWSAQLLLDHPDAIVEAHRAFFDAGAEVATTATYQATFDGFAAHGIERGRTVELMRTASRWPRGGREVRRPTDLGGGVAGPYGAMLADGSEYHGRYGLHASASCESSIDRGWRCWPRPGPTSWHSRPFRAPQRSRRCSPRSTALGIDCWVSVSIEGSADERGRTARRRRCHGRRTSTR